MILAIINRGEVVEVYDGRSSTCYTHKELAILADRFNAFCDTPLDYYSPEYLEQEEEMKLRRNPPEKSLHALLGIFKPAISALRIPRIK